MTAPVRKRRRPGKGTLFIISSLLIGSAVIRLGADAGQAFANTAPAESLAHDAAPVASECKTPDELRAMLAAFKERDSQLKIREENMRDRLQALAVADREIEQKMAVLIDAEEKLRSTLALADSAAEDDITRLVTVYENMKPKDAATLFEEMEPEFAAGFVGRMAPEAAANLMAGLSPKAAYSISVILAGRNARVPKE